MFNRRKFQDAWISGKSVLKSNCWRDGHGVIYHKTRIIEFVPTGARVWSGGWRTPTTKEHINYVLTMMGIKAHIFQKAGVWYLTDGAGTHEFQEGMTV